MTAVDPVVLFYLLGLSAGILKSDLRLPPAIFELLSVLLLLAIGLKGGVELAQQSLLTLGPRIFAVALLGFLLPLAAYPVLYFVGRLERPDAASIAAHYGSVSVGTYAVGAAYLTSLKVPFENFMALFLVILEMPAIVVGVLLSRGVKKEMRWGALAHEILLGKSIVLLAGGLLIGWALGPAGVKSISSLFFDLFPGVLALFLLEIGLISASHVGSLRRHGAFLIVFGVAMPLFSAVIGCGLGWALSLSVGGTMLLATLSASASYIAVPAAMRLMVPEANPALSLASALGVTFPFNVVVGVPLYFKMSVAIHGLGA